MFTEEFLEKYPNTLSFVKDSIIKRTIDSFGSIVDEGTRDMYVAIVSDNNTIIGALNSSPGNMLNILDEAGVHFYVYPVLNHDTNTVHYLYASINDGNKPDDSIVYFPKRIDAEYWAVQEAFEMSEYKLRQVKA